MRGGEGMQDEMRGNDERRGNVGRNEVWQLLDDQWIRLWENEFEYNSRFGGFDSWCDSRSESEGYNSRSEGYSSRSEGIIVRLGGKIVIIVGLRGIIAGLRGIIISLREQ